MYCKVSACNGSKPLKKDHTEVTAKVVAASWGTELFLLNAALEMYSSAWII